MSAATYGEIKFTQLLVAVIEGCTSLGVWWPLITVCPTARDYCPWPVCRPPGSSTKMESKPIGNTRSSASPLVLDNVDAEGDKTKAAVFWVRRLAPLSISESRYSTWIQGKTLLVFDLVSSDFRTQYHCAEIRIDTTDLLIKEPTLLVSKRKIPAGSSLIPHKLIWVEPSALTILFISTKKWRRAIRTLRCPC